MQEKAGHFLNAIDRWVDNVVLDVDIVEGTKREKNVSHLSWREWFEIEYERFLSINRFDQFLWMSKASIYFWKERITQTKKRYVFPLCTGIIKVKH